MPIERLRPLHPFGSSTALDANVLRARIGAYSKRFRVRLAAYLRSGIPLTDWMGYSDDILARTSVWSGTGNVLTDGTYLWRDEAAYYVETYGISVDDGFLAHSENSSWQVPALPLSHVRYLELLEDQNGRKHGTHRPLFPFVAGGVIQTDGEILALLQGALSEDLRVKVARYLRESSVIYPKDQPIEDVIGGRFTGSSSIMSDGIFFWPDIAADYVEVYGIAPEDSFIAYRAQHSWDPVGLTWDVWDRIYRDPTVLCDVSEPVVDSNVDPQEEPHE